MRCKAFRQAYGFSSWKGEDSLCSISSHLDFHLASLSPDQVTLFVFLLEQNLRFWLTFLTSSCLHDIGLSLGNIPVTITSAFGFLSNFACTVRVRPLLMSSGVIWSMLLVPLCITATCKFFGNFPCLILQRMFWIQTLEVIAQNTMISSQALGDRIANK